MFDSRSLHPSLVPHVVPLTKYFTSNTPESSHLLYGNADANLSLTGLREGYINEVTDMKFLVNSKLSHCTNATLYYSWVPWDLRTNHHRRSFAEGMSRSKADSLPP